MAVRPILRFPDKRLSWKAVAVGEIGRDILKIWDDMIDTMEAMPGVGLAAPQIGVNLALCVVDASDSRGQAVRMADPVLKAVVEQGTFLSEEASPCLPGIFERVERNRRVLAEFTDETGTRRTREFDGLWAASVQHQVDHLRGRLFIDKLSPTKRDMAVRRFRKLQARG